MNIWKDGFEIERDGQKITLTTEEIRAIQTAIEVAYGRGSIEYFLDSILDDEPEERVNAAKEMMEDDRECACIWNEFLDDVFYDSGEAEYNTVNYAIDRYIEKKGENE